MSTLVDDRVDVLERENAELRRLLAERTAERDEALAQQTATAEVLQVINSSPGDLAPVFDAILEKAHTLCGAVQGAMFLFTDGHFRAVATRGMPEAFNARMRAGMRGAGYPLTEPLLAGERFNQIVDIALVDHPITRAAVEIAGARTVLAVALRKDNLLLGMIVAARREVRPFSDREIALIENFAGQAVIAIENARLLTETREALEQQTATAEVLQVINASPGDLAPVFDAILERAHTLCGATLGSLRIIEGGYNRSVALRGHGAEYAEELRQRQPFSDGPIGKQLFDGAPFVHILDTAELDHPRARRSVEQSGTRTLLVVPLRKDDTLLGSIFAARQEVRPFTDKQIALLQNFAAQAVIAMENARLLTETREALEQQTATAEILSVINNSPGELTPVFDAMLDRALRLCEGAFGTLFTYEDGLFHQAATRNRKVAIERPFSAGPQSAAGRLVRGERFVHIADARDSDAYRSGDPSRVRIVDVEGARSYLAVPMRKGETLLGVITIYRQEVRPFTDKQIALLENFAAQAVIAMENARLLTETREALEQQTATAEVLQVINASPGDLAPVFEAMLERATRLCEADAGVFCTYSGEDFLPTAWRGFDDFPREPIRPHPETGIGRLAGGEDVVHILDSASGDAYRSGDPGRLAIVRLGGARTQVAAALRKEGRLLGSFTLWRRQVRPFTDTQIALLENFAAQAVIAMENARLLTETREALEQQTATAEVLQVINASPGDLAPVFDAILDKAHTLCGVAHGSLQLYDGEKFRAVAVHGLPDALAALLMEGYSPNPSTPNYKLLEGAPFVQIADMAEIDFPLAQEVVKHGGTRTHLLVALRKEGNLLGQIVAARKEVRLFSDKEIALLQNFAAQAVIAMENARLLTETREALEQQTATAEVLQVINSSPGDLVPVFDAMLARASKLCEADVGTLWTFDGSQFWPAVALDPTIREKQVARRPAANKSLGRIMQGEDVVHVLDVTVEPGYLDDPEVKARTSAVGTRSVLSVALRKHGQLLGAITTGRRSVRAYTDKQIALLQNFAAQAVIAMENARLLGELRARNDEIAGWNRELEDRVAAQLGELERVGRLKRFLAPQLAELIVARGDENILETHRRDIVVVFCDLRGFTAFAETAEPEEVLDLLREYHGALGPVVAASEGTLDHFSGDGIMVFFNDPVPVPDASERAVRMAIEMRVAAGRLQAQWRRQGREIGFGVGIARGYATLGQIGFADRIDYTAIGTVCNLAARLCAEAKDGQILIARRVAAAVEDMVRLEEVGDLALKGLMQAVAVYNVAAE